MKFSCTVHEKEKDEVPRIIEIQRNDLVNIRFKANQRLVYLSLLREQPHFLVKTNHIMQIDQFRNPVTDVCHVKCVVTTTVLRNDA